LDGENHLFDCIYRDFLSQQIVLGADSCSMRFHFDPGQNPLKIKNRGKMLPLAANEPKRIPSAPWRRRSSVGPTGPRQQKVGREENGSRRVEGEGKTDWAG
jgi:hypothetical protein